MKTTFLLRAIIWDYEMYDVNNSNRITQINLLPAPSYILDLFLIKLKVYPYFFKFVHNGEFFRYA